MEKLRYFLYGAILVGGILFPIPSVSGENVAVQEPVQTIQNTGESKVVNALTGFGAIDLQLARSIEKLCKENTTDTNLCVKHIIWVSSAESSVFKRCSHNNCFWLMRCWKQWCSLRRYNSIAESIEDRLKVYNKNERQRRTTGQMWLNWKYCASACTYWIQNYNSAISKLNLE